MIYKRFIHKTVSARCRIYTAEIPVTKVVRTSIVQAFKTLEYKFQLGFQVDGFEQIGYLA